MILKFQFKISDLFKIPNILCYIRIAMVPWFISVYLNAQTESEYRLAALIVVLSGLTDFLDGQIARRCNMISDLGKMIDPFADKLMQFAMVAVLAVKVPYVLGLVIYFVIKELVSTVLAWVAYKVSGSHVSGAKWYGKVCTAVLYVVMLAIIAFPFMNVGLRSALLILCAAVLTLSFAMYVKLYVTMILDYKAGKKERLY